jgi:protein phosphatase 2C family protein 2/3
MMREKRKEDEGTALTANVDDVDGAGRNSAMNTESSQEIADTSTATANSVASTSELAIDKPRKYVPPMMRKKLEEAAALASVPEDNSSALLGNDAPSEASVAAKQKYIPPQVRTASASSTAVPTPAASIAISPGLPTDAAFGTDRFGWCVNQGPRPGMEDAIDAITQLEGDIPTEFYAVYDGHSGTSAVEFTLRRLPQLLRRQESFNDPARLRQALYDSFISLDAELLEHLRSQAPPSSSSESAGNSFTLSSGCVSTVALIRENRIYVSNLGDCRAVLCRDGNMIQLTVDHHPAENEVEVERLRTLGVEVSNDGYLHGRIGVSRAFGDWAWHANEKCIGLSCEPELYEAEITQDTEFLLLACDGIFENMSSAEAGKTVRRKLRATRDAKASAEALVKTAVKMNGTDNLSAVVVLFNPPPSNDGERVAPRLLFKKKAPAPEEVA